MHLTVANERTNKIMDSMLKRAALRYGQLHQSITAPDAKPVLQQLREILALRKSSSRLSADQYFLMNFGSTRLYKGVDLESFGGTYQTVALHKQLNNPDWDATCTDKLVMASIFSACDLPQPKLYAVASRYKRQMGGVPFFHDKAALVEFIKSSISYPFFTKPVKTNSASGCERVESYDRSANLLTLANGKQLSPEDFVAGLKDPEGWGFLFQEAMLPHSETLDVANGAVSGCRIVVLARDDGPQLFRVVWKIPAKGNYVDNFVRGKTGNMAADVDPKTGTVRRVIAGTYTQLKVNPPLPGSGRDLVGTQLPDWEQVNKIVERAALAFPGFRFQHWDVGLTSRGPVIYELNTAGGLSLVELARGEGIFNEEFKQFLAQYGRKGTRWHLAGGPPVD